MAIDDIDFANAVLDNTLGPARGSNGPDSIDIAPFMGDPKFGGTEVTTGGVTRVAWDSDDWGPADDALTQTTSDVDFGSPSAALPDTITHWAGFDGATRVLSGRVTAVDVTSSGGPSLTIRPTLAIADL